MRKPVTCESLEGRVFLTVTPNDSSYASEWGLSAINASRAWDTSKGSAATVVADIDTGLDYTHDDLYLNVWINQDEIPAAMKKVLKDTDGDGRITFYDLNAGANKGKVTDVNKDGMLQGPNLELLRNVCATTDRPVVASGGITELADLEALTGLVDDGVEGAIIGTALYEGRFTLEDALALTRPAQP